MRFLISVTLLLLLFLPLAACERVWNTANRSSLEADMRSLLKPCGLDPMGVKCGMAGTTREAWAAFSATPTHVSVLVKCLGLEAAGEGSDLRRIASYKESGFPASEGVSLAEEGVEVWGTTKRIPLKSGSTFSYLILLFDSRAGRVGLRMAYAYG